LPGCASSAAFLLAVFLKEKSNNKGNSTAGRLPVIAMPTVPPLPLLLLLPALLLLVSPGASRVCVTSSNSKT
jgi:hypothetical protein